MGNGAVNVKLSLGFLRRMLNLTDDYEIVQVHNRNMWNGTVEVIITSDKLPAIEEGAYPPEAQIEYKNGIDGNIERVRFITIDYPPEEIVEVYNNKDDDNK